MKEEEKDLSYWEANAKDSYLHTPICVLRYITELEKQLKKCNLQNVRESALDAFDRGFTAGYNAGVKMGLAMLLPDINEFDNEAEQFAEGGFSTEDEKNAYTTAWQECRQWLVNRSKGN